MANSADPDQTVLKEQSDLGLHSLSGHFCLNIFGHFGTDLCLILTNLCSKYNLFLELSQSELKESGIGYL